MITNNMTVPSHDRSKNILLLFACTCILHAPSWAIRILFSNGTTRHKKLFRLSSSTNRLENVSNTQVQ